MSNPPPSAGGDATQTPIRHKYRHIAPRVPPQHGFLFYGGRSFLPTPISGGMMHIYTPTHIHQQHQHTRLHHSVHPKVSASPSSVSDHNGYKDTRDITRDDSFATVRDRKVRITDGASLYAQCRSWLRNGLPEESQPQYLDVAKSLSRPLPIPVRDIHSPKKEDGDKEEEDEGDVEQLSSKKLLQRHIKRAMKVRARLREERLQRIARYKTRLAFLFAPIVEQQLRNDTATGN